MKHLHEFLLHTNKIKFLITTPLFGVLLNFLMAGVFLILFETTEGENNTSYLQENLSLGSLFFGVVIGPFIETLIFQYFFIIFLGKSFSEKLNDKILMLLIVVSALFFGAIHLSFGILYAISAFIMGIYLGYITILSVFLREYKINIFLSVYAVHAIINLSVLLPRFFL